MNCRGDDGIDAKRSRPSIGKTRYKCHARLERAVLVGTRSADYIRASGHSGRIQRPYTWLHPTPFAEMPDFSLAPRAPSIHGIERTKSDVCYAVANGGKADSARLGQNRRK